MLTLKKPPARAPSAGWDETRRVGKMAEKLAHQIVDDVLEQGLVPGDMLPAEAEMIQSYKVGRATVREALRVLEVQGLVTLKPGPGGGPVLNDLSAADFARMAKFHLLMRGSTYREVLAARLAIEPLMARLAAEARPPDGLEKLRAAIKVADGIDANDETAWRAASELFHETIAGISGNSVLDLLGRSLKEIYRTGHRAALTPPKMRAQVMAVHRAIADAIFKGKADVAEKLMRDHMAEFAERSDKLHARTLKERITWN
jgi:GntR family transcriptional repressor for pyruvate dehydrogenase complex